MLKWLIGIIVEPCAFKIKAKLFVIFIFVVKMSYDLRSLTLLNLWCFYVVLII